MNRVFKMSAVAMAVMCATSVFAEDDLISFEGNREEVVGWTPVCVGLATPVQMPFGMNKWDVFGLDLNLLYSDAPKVYGVNIGGLAAVTRNNLAGLQVAALANYAVENVYGARLALGINIAKTKMMAFVVSAALAGMAGALYGLNYSTVTAAKFRFDTSILVLVFVVLGGIGSIRGSGIAATLLTVLPEVLQAEEYGIEIIPEIQSWGHTQYITVAYPELAEKGQAATYGMISHIPLRGMVRKQVIDIFANSYKLNATEIDLSDSSAVTPGSGESEGEKKSLIDKIINWYVKKKS